MKSQLILMFLYQCFCDVFLFLNYRVFKRSDVFLQTSCTICVWVDQILWYTLGNVLWGGVLEISLWKERFKKPVMIRNQMFQIAGHTMNYNRGKKQCLQSELKATASSNGHHVGQLNLQISMKCCVWGWMALRPRLLLVSSSFSPLGLFLLCI